MITALTTALTRRRASKWLALGSAAWIGYEIHRRWPRVRIRDKVALVTGGSRGLGFLIARQLLTEGAVVVICARSWAELEEAERRLAPYGSVFPWQCDVADRDAVEELMGELLHAFGRIDIVVNNAGQMLVGPLRHMSHRDFRSAMELHFGGALHVLDAVLPSMRQRRSGSIVNIGSVGGLVPVPHMAPYAASKFALVGLSRAMREELRADGIHVTTVCPGPLRTGSPFRARFKGRHEEEFAWFTLSDSLPLLSTDAEKAARRIVQAIRASEPELVIGLPAALLQSMQGLAPNLTAHLMALMSRLLPRPGGIGARSVTGDDSTARLEGTWALRRTAKFRDRLQDLNGSG